MMELDVAVVGGGLAGLSAAYVLAREGLGVIVFERGDHPGSKNVTGGRLYLEPIRDLLPDLWEGAPFERWVVKERLTALSDGNAVTLEYQSPSLSGHSATVLRARFDKWLAEKVGQAGAFIVPQKKVTDLLWDGQKVAGVKVGDEEIPAKVVVLCDGVLSPLAERAGLRDPIAPGEVALGFKEVIKLDPEEIDRRFGVKGDQGVAQLFFGEVSKGLFGGGFLYTNRDSLSLGVVVGLREFSQHPRLEVPTLLEEFKAHPCVAPLVEGGELVEYSAHLIPEGLYHKVRALYAGGVLLAGDAAGFALNHGVTVRGMDFAIASGVCAAQAILDASKKGDFSAGSLRAYEERLRSTFVLRDMEAFKGASEVLSKTKRLYDLYPWVLTDLLGEVFRVPREGKERISKVICRHLRSLCLDPGTWRDMWRLRGL